MLYGIDMSGIPKDFWQIAEPATEVLLQKHERHGTDVRLLAWTPMSSDACQIAFYFRNQLFFVCMNAPTWELDPGIRGLFIKRALQARAIPCVFSVFKKNGRYVPVKGDWGLAHAYDDSGVIPPEMATDDEIELTDRELQIESVLLIDRILQQRGCAATTMQTQLEVNPSVYFTEDQRSSAVIVRSSRLPNGIPGIPENMEEIMDAFAGRVDKLYFAGVQCGCDEEDFNRPGEQVRSILRGMLPVMRFDGLVQVL